MKNYFKTTWYNITHNCAYTLFLVLGTALTFVFVTILVHLATVLEGEYPPMSKAATIITLGDFADTEGNPVPPLSESEQKLLLSQIGDYEEAAVYVGNSNFTGAAAVGHYFTTNVTFANPAFWRVYKFRFVNGRPFTDEESTARKRCVVITKNLSQKRFNTAHSAGKTIEMDRTEYTVVGVVDNISMFAAPAGAVDMYFPLVFNNAVWEGTSLSILFKKGTNMQQTKTKIAELTRKLYASKNVKIALDVKTILTQKETSQKISS
jgi:hypothetical protein